MSFPTYPAYKNSGIEWVDILPIHWEKVALKWVSKIFAGGTPDKTKTHYWENGSIPWLNSGAVNQVLISEPSAFITTEAFNSSSARWIPAGSLVMALAGQGKTKGMVAQLAIRTTCNQSMAAITPAGNVKPKYLFWWLSNNYQNIRNMAGGDLRDGLNLELIGDIPALMPSEEEQTQIARFLDHETARIDALIEEQQRLIELLKEKRQAVISQAVTKGLDPTVPMKDSGVEWLGEVPAHWDVIRYKLALRVFQGMAFKSSDYVEYSDVVSLRMGNIKKGGAIDLDHNLKYLPNGFSSEYDAYALREGDVVIAMTDMSPSLDFLAVPATIKDSRKDVSYLLNQRVGKLIFLPGVEAQFIKYTLLSSQLRGQLKGRGLGTVQANMSNDDLYCSFLAMPARKEQIDIVVFLDKAVSEIDEMVGEALKVNQLLNERRSALISAAVTGKIDVRGWKPPASAKVKELEEETI